MFNGKKTGAFIVPTGIGASIGGYAGDASSLARKFAENHNLIVNPNVVNAGCFSGITNNMFYVEGYILDEFFRGNVGLKKEINKNKIGVVLDKGISKEVLNIHINTINAVKTIYGINIEYKISEKEVEVDFYIDNSGISTGRVKNIETLLKISKELLKEDCNAIAIVCKFKEDILNADYENGIGVDPIGGVEAIISHYLSKELLVPVAHSPAFEDYSILTEIVNPKASAEYITPTFLPCILIGLNEAPQIIDITRQINVDGILTISNLDFLIMPFNSLGSTPVFEASKRGIQIYAIKNNKTVLNVDSTSLRINNIIEIETYKDCLKLINGNNQ